MAEARIYQPSKTAMQSGRGKSGSWILDFEPATPRRPEPLMGWASSGDTLNQVRLTFASKEEAIAFAERKGLAYSVAVTNDRQVRPRNYGDRFKAPPPK